MIEIKKAENSVFRYSFPLTMIPMGRYGQPNPVMCDLSMVEHYIMREKRLKIY